MDKEMRKVTKDIRRAEKDIRKGKPAAAMKELKKGEKKNVKLANFDERVRDPQIKKYKEMMHKGR